MLPANVVGVNDQVSKTFLSSHIQTYLAPIIHVQICRRLGRLLWWRQKRVGEGYRGARNHRSVSAIRPFRQNRLVSRSRLGIFPTIPSPLPRNQSSAGLGRAWWRLCILQNWRAVSSGIIADTGCVRGRWSSSWRTRIEAQQGKCHGMVLILSLANFLSPYDTCVTHNVILQTKAGQRSTEVIQNVST